MKDRTASVWAKKLKELITEMDSEVARLNQDERRLMRVLQFVLTTFWFFQIEDFYQFVTDWRLSVTHPLVNDALRSIENAPTELPEEKE